MRICHVGSGFFPVPPLAGGGSERFLYNLAREQAKLGHEVHVLDLSWPEMGFITQDDLVQFHRLAPFRPLKRGIFLEAYFNWHLLKAVRGVVRKNRINILHFHTPIPCITCSLLTRACGLKIAMVLTVHNPLLSEDHLTRRFATWKSRLIYFPAWIGAIRKADSVVCLNSGMMEVATSIGRSHGRLFVVPTAADLERFYPQPRVQKKTGSILYVAVVNPFKNQEVIIRACATIAQLVSEILFVGAVSPGYGSYRKHLETLANFLGLGQKVKFLGSVPNEDLPDLYNQSQIYIHASFGEGMSLAVLEALSCGSFVIASDIPSHRDFIRPMENGLLFPPDDPTALAKEIANTLNDTELFKRVSSNAPRFARQDANWSAMCKRYMQIYEETMIGVKRKR